MAKINPQRFKFLNDTRVEQTLIELYTHANKQNWSIFFHFLPKIFQFLGKGIDWKDEQESFYEDKYIPITPEQGALIYMQIIASGARNIVEFGTSYGISTIYLAKAAKENKGKVITTEYLPHKVEIAKKNFEKAGLSDYIEIWEGDAMETLKNIKGEVDFVLLDGWPDMALPVFQILEPNLRKGAVIAVDDVKGFEQSMKNYLEYIRNPQNGYASTTLYPKKAMELSVKMK